ncbi:lytic polysaccharide monooxygenase [Xylariaceae sp. FL0016]|nr:lytic polysaccharide monooxygenase [Xylariaceae sp. FL0016]
MKLYVGILAIVAFTNAHTIFTTLFVNDVTQGDGTCVRMNMTPNNCTSPVASLTSDAMACGSSGQEPVAFTCPVAAGGKLTFEWRKWADAEQPGVLDISHKGPCAIYAKQLPDRRTSAAGSGWLKLWDEGYDATRGKWCTEKLMDANGLLSFAVPEGLPAGHWLFRPELLALHNAEKNDPQFYVGCAQVFVQTSNTAPLSMPATFNVSIPGHVKAGDPGLTFNIYAPHFPYPMPGPAVFVPPAPKTNSGKSGSGTGLVQTEGGVPADYLIKNANWVGVEVPDYMTEGGCWDSSEDCWKQAGRCYDTAPPSGSANCRVFEAKCQGIQDNCSAGNFVGPPNKGVKLVSEEPTPPSNIPVAVNVSP